MLPHLCYQLDPQFSFLLSSKYRKITSEYINTRFIWYRVHLLQGQTAMHSVATLNDDKSYAGYWSRGSYSSFEPLVNLDYQQAVETLLAHGTDLSAQDNQVNT